MARQPIYLVILLIFTSLVSSVRALPQLVIDPQATACSSTGSLSGQLTDLQQHPLINTEVQLFRDQPVGDWSTASLKRELVVAASQMTDNQGKFRFDHLSPDAYTLFAKPTDTRYASRYFGGSSLLSQAQLVKVVAQQETQGVNIALPNAIATSSIAVKEQISTPMQSLTEVNLKAVSGKLSYTGQFDLQGQAQAPQGGFQLTRFDLSNPVDIGDRAEFTLELDQQANYKLFIVPYTFRPGPFAYRLKYDPAPNSPFLSDSIDLPKLSACEVINNLKLHLPLGGQIKGHLLDKLGKALPNIKLYHYGYNPSGLRPDLLSSGTTALTDVNGHYELNGLGTGFYLIGTQAETSYSLGAAALYDHSRIPQRYPSTFYKLKSTPKLATGLNVVQGIPLQVADMQLSSGGCVAGQVVDGRGQVLAHIRVKVTSLEDPSWFVGSPSYTDADGRYQVTRLNPGQYQASFERADLE